MPTKKKPLPTAPPPVFCKCGKPGTTGDCPYQADVNNKSFECDCCTDCRRACAEDI